MTTNNDNPNKVSSVIFCLLVLLICLFGCVQSCSAKDGDVLDTIPAKVECITKIVTKETTKSERYFAVYIDKQQDIVELIYIPKSVKEYIEECKNNGLPARIGIKLKNGEIQSIVRRKIKRK